VEPSWQTVVFSAICPFTHQNNFLIYLFLYSKNIFKKILLFQIKFIFMILIFKKIKKKLILIYFQIKNILKNKYYHNF
jgi:hypothetical protein